jgi:hypothetical protein
MKDVSCRYSDGGEGCDGSLVVIIDMDLRIAGLVGTPVKIPLGKRH